MEDCKVPDSARSLIIAGIPAYSNWKPYKRWCSENGKKVWTVSVFSDFSFDAAADQLAAFLGDIRNSTTTHVGGHGTLCNFRSTVNTAFMTVFKCGSLSDSSRVSRLMRGFGKLKPSQPRWQWEDTAWDPGLIIQYWIDQPDNDRLTDAELAFKSFALFAIAVWPRCSDAARVVRSSIKFAPDDGDLVFRYFGTKELKLPILSAGIGIPAGQVSRVCPVRTLKAYLTRSKDWDHGDRVWCCTRKQGGKYLPVTEKGCTLRRWMRNMMTRVGIDPKWTGGSIRMAASSKALDDGLEPAYIMQVGRWRSFAMWNAFYNRSCCRLVNGRTFASGTG